MDNSISIFIAGDVVPRNRTVELFKQKQTDLLFHDFIPYIKGADISIVNLEAPIIEGDETPIKKSGPVLYTTRQTLEVLKDASFNTITLANNHFRDQGQQGVDCTIDAANQLGIDYVGGGKTLEEARRILYKNVGEEKIAIINVCEHEFSIATNNYGGCNPLDTIDTYNDIQKAKSQADYVLLIVHGGVEQYQLPTPRMKRQYRFFIDAGADAVLNHHQHCFSGYEVYKEKPIFYGLGNFCFDCLWNRPLPQWKYGYAVHLTLNGTIQFDIIPYEQCGDEPKIVIRNEPVFLNEIEKLNTIIADEEVLNEKFNELVLSEGYELLLNLIPIKNGYFRGLFRRGYLGKLYGISQILNLKNKLYCQSHLECLKQYFGILTK